MNRSEYYQIIEKLRCGWEDGKPTIVMALPVGTVELDESLLFDLRSVARKQFGFATALVLEDDLEDGPRFIFHKPDLTYERFRNSGSLRDQLNARGRPKLRIVSGSSKDK